MPPLPSLGTPFARPTLSLNTAGIAGFFGGDVAISAMATAHLYEKGRFLGWFNFPGSYTIAKRFGRMTNSSFWNGLFPGPNESSAVVFGFDGKKGPQYIAAVSGTTLTTGHLGYLTMKRGRGEATRIEGRTTTPVNVSYLAMNALDDTGVEIKLLSTRSALWGLIPIFTSFSACALSIYFQDWASSYVILLGIISGGVARVSISREELVIKPVSKPAEGAPTGHGILMGEDGVVVIKGAERDVNVITQGRFDLVKRSSKEKSEEEEAEEDDTPNYHAIGLCSVLLSVQFFQLLLIPQGSLFGQLMFLVSLSVSWAYNIYLSSLKKENIQEKILFDALKEPEMVRFRTGTKTTMAVFACLLLFHGVKCTTANEERSVRDKVLNACMLNDRVVWALWKEKIVQHLLDINVKPDTDISRSLDEDMEDERLSVLPEQERKLFKQLLDDARDAFKGYVSVRDGLPRHSSDS